MASEPTSRTALASPREMASQNSPTRRWGPWPPVISRMARAGSAPIRFATERGKLLEAPKGGLAPGEEISNWRMAAMTSRAAARSPEAPASARAARAAAPARSAGERA